MRPLFIADQPAVASLERLCFRHPWSPAVLTTELEHPAVLARGAEIDGTLIGYALFRRAGVEAELARIAVDPERRGNRVARRLMAACLDELQGLGTVETFLEVRTTNRAARALYESFDFHEVGLRRAYYPDGTDALVLRRTGPAAQSRTTS